MEEAGQSLSYAIAEASRPDHELHYYLGSVELRLGNAPNAISEAERALALAPRFAPARKLLSDAYLVSQDTVQAARELILYLRSARNREEAAAIRERLKAINSLSRAKPESSVQVSFVPPRIHKVPKAASTIEARRNRVEGAVKVEVLLGSDGLIQQVIVVQGLGFGLDEQAILAAKGISYTPAMYNNKPVSVWMGIYFMFIIVDDDEKRSKEKYKIAALTIR